MQDREKYNKQVRENKEVDVYRYFHNGVSTRPNESIEVTLKRFKREVINGGILTEVKKREFFEKPSVTRKKLKEVAARKKNKRPSFNAYRSRV